MMILQHITNSIRLRAVACLISLITITVLSSVVKGSHVKTDGWSDTYNQHLDLTGTIRELAPSDNNDDTDTRFQPPLDSDEENIPAIAEGYRLAASEMIAPAISISINKEIPRERPKRDAPLDNSSISPSAFQPIVSRNNDQSSATLSNNDTDDDTIISDADEKAWALSLSLSAGFDGSGSEEPTTVTDFTHTETITTVQLTTTESVEESITASMSTEIITLTSVEGTETEVTITSTSPTTEENFTELTETVTETESTPITSESVTEATAETEIVTSGETIISETSTVQTTIEQSTEEETASVSESGFTLTTLTPTIYQPSTVSESSIQTSEFITASITPSGQTITEATEIPTISNTAITSITSSESSTQTSTSIFVEVSWFILHYTYEPTSGRRRRAFSIGSPPTSDVETEVVNILNEINVTCNSSCVHVSDNSLTPPDVDLYVQLSVNLTILQRILLNNGLFINNVRLNSSYQLTTIMNMNPQYSFIYNITGVLPLCKLCEYAFTGNCTANDNNTCVCYPEYTGQYCQYPANTTTSYTTLLSSMGYTNTGTGETSTMTLPTGTASSTTIVELTGTATGETSTMTLPTGTASSTTIVEVTGTGTSQTTTLVTFTENTGSTTTFTSVGITGTGTTESSTITLPTGTTSSTTIVEVTGTGTSQTSTLVTFTENTGSTTTSTSVGITGTGTGETSTITLPTGTTSSTTIVGLTGTGTSETSTLVTFTENTGSTTTFTSVGITGTGTGETSTIIANTASGATAIPTMTIGSTGTATGETSTATASSNNTNESTTVLLTEPVTAEISTLVPMRNSSIVTTVLVTGTATSQTSTIEVLTGNTNSITTIGPTVTGTGETSTLAVPNESTSSTIITTTIRLMPTGTEVTMTVPTEYTSSTTMVSETGTGTTTTSTVVLPTENTGSTITTTSVSLTGTGTNPTSTAVVPTENTGSTITTTSLSLTGTGTIVTSTAVVPTKNTGSTVTTTSVSLTGTGTITTSTAVVPTENTGSTITTTSVSLTGTGTIVTSTAVVPTENTGSTVTTTSVSLTGTGTSATSTAVVPTENTGSTVTTTSVSLTGTGTSPTSTVVVPTENTGSTITATTVSLTGTGTSASSTAIVPTENTGSTITTTSLSLTGTGTIVTSTAVVPTENTGSTVTTTSVSLTGTGTSATSTAVVPTENTGSTVTTTSVSLTGTGTSATATGISPTENTGSTITTTSFSLTRTGTEVTSTVTAPIEYTSSPTIVLVTGTGTSATSTALVPTENTGSTVTTTSLSLTGTGTSATSTVVVPTENTGSTITTTSVSLTGTGTSATSTVVVPTENTGSTVTTTSLSLTGTGTIATSTVVVPTENTGSTITTTSVSLTGTGTIVTSTVVVPTENTGSTITTTSVSLTGTGTIATSTAVLPTENTGSTITTTPVSVTGTGTNPTFTTVLPTENTGSTVTTTSVSLTGTGTGTGGTSTITIPTENSSTFATAMSVGITEAGTGQTSTLVIPTENASATMTIGMTGTAIGEISTESIRSSTIATSIGVTESFTVETSTVINPTASTSTTIRMTSGGITGASIGETGTVIVPTESINLPTTTASIGVRGTATGETSTVVAATENTNSTGGMTVIGVTGTITGETTTLTLSAGLTSSITTASVSTTASTQVTASTTPIITIVSSPVTTVITNGSTTVTPRNCGWTNWVPTTNCSPSCGTAYRESSRSCIDSIGGGNCSINDCGGGVATQNESCSFSPPCQNVTLVPQPTTRIPNLRLVSYDFPESMYFFEGTYTRIWVTNLGYISFDSAYYGQTMTSPVFSEIANQAIAAPFWADLVYEDSYSTITINWYSSVSADQNSRDVYDPIILRTVQDACPADYCPQNYSALLAAQITWGNLLYQTAGSNDSIRLGFTAYLINTYDVSSYSYPILRSYIAFDYTNVPNNIGNLKPFVGFRGRYSMVLVLNDPLFHQNAAFLTQSTYKGFNVGASFLTKCEVSYLQESTTITMDPSQNLNDVTNNPQFPCPCTIGQAQNDRRFARLMSETRYELNQYIQCYGPIMTSWIPWTGGTSKMLRSQTCCYDQINGGLVTSGYSAGSVLSTPFILFQIYSFQRRIEFHDQCCSPIYPSVTPNWDLCRLYYKLHPASSCTGYQAPAIVSGVGDPHIDTMDSGRYTCHIQGLFVFAQTSTQAGITAQANLNNANGFESSLIYPDDLFYIYVRSASLPPVLPYVERMQGDASVFTGYTVGAGTYVFVITSSQGRFGFTATSNSVTLTLTANLTSNLNFDYTSSSNYNDQYIYRLKQASASVSNMTVPRLTLSIWSGVTLQCQIVGENLECVLSLPEKFQTHLEGLAGNFNGDYSDDLVNRLTNQVVTISPTSNPSNLTNDSAILSACRSWKVSTDTTVDISKPILPTNLITWYYSQSAALTNLNPKLSPAIVDQTCSSSIECRHDYIIRINPTTSKATAASVNAFIQAKVFFAQIQPTINISSTVTIELPFNNSNRNYLVPVSISGANSTLVTISSNGTQQTTVFNGAYITIPVPSDTGSYVQAFLTVTYGLNSTMIYFLNIITCLCMNSSYCNYVETTGLADHYAVASCTCPDVLDGEFCELIYDGCDNPDACKILWNNGATCIQLSPAQQIQQGQSYYCNGTCEAGYSTNNSFACEDTNECNINSSRCGPGICVNQVGSYSCTCLTGYKFDGTTCVDLNECEEPNIDGVYPSRCNNSDQCTNTIGSYTCACSPVFMNNGICQYNPSLCINDTCRGNNNTLLCLHGTINRNNACIPWCEATCPNFCERTNGNFQCNCAEYPGYEYLNNGQQCSPCDDANYGYSCNQSCECIYGTCNPNATVVTQSCTCDLGYESMFCDKRIDICAKSNPCNNATEDCITSPSNFSAICNCKVGYARNSSTSVCQDINECYYEEDDCDHDVSYCNNTIGSYICICYDGFLDIDDECFDIDECDADISPCLIYNNTYCANTPGSYECRCEIGFALGGNYLEQYGDARDSTEMCLPIDYSEFCQGQCSEPAYCSASTGNCECPSSTYTLVDYALDDFLQTCDCPGHPIVYYNGSQCVNVTGIAWFLLDLTNKEIDTRVALVNQSDSASIEIKLSNILSAINKTCNESCIDVYDTQDFVPPDLQLLTTLNTDLNITERLMLLNSLFNQSITYNDSYSLSMVQLIVLPTYDIPLPAIGVIYNFTGPQPICEECTYLQSGSCTTDLSNCNCSTGYEGYFCRIRSGITITTTQQPLQASPTSSMTNWTVIVAVVSSIGGLLLIISISMCVFFIVTKWRRYSKDTKPRMSRQQFSIPRAHIPTLGTGTRGLHPFDDFSLDDSSDEQFVDASDSFPSNSSTTYNTTYRPNGKRPQADFGIFDELESRIPFSKGNIPRPQMLNMLGTLNSLSSDEPSGTTSSFSDLRNIDEVESVTDMVHDMTKEDDIEDEFVEALNPNLKIPRLAADPELTSTGWFSFFGHS